MINGQKNICNAIILRYRTKMLQDRDVFGMLLTGSIRYLSDEIENEEELYAVRDRRSISGRKLKWLGA